MIKINIPSLHPALVEQSGGVVSTTLGEYTDANIKQASNNTITEEMLREVRPDKDNILIHLIALGDHERVGPNRNNDSYTKEANESRHKTFETHAHVFQEHQNKDPNKRIGDVKIARYNPEMGRVELAIWLNRQKAPQEFEMAKQGKQLTFSMACKIKEDVCNICKNSASSPAHYCFPPDTRISLYDGTQKPIENVEVGDIVLGADGLPTRVVQLFNRTVDETLSVLPNSLNGNCYDLISTSNHPISSAAGEFGFLAGLYHTHFRGHSIPEGTRYIDRENIPRNDIPWSFIDAGDLLKGDLVRMPVIKKDPKLWKGEFDEEDAWVIGLFLAEGSFSKQNTPVNGRRSSLQFSMHGDEVEYISRLNTWAETRHGRSVKTYYSKRSKGVSVRIHHTELAESFYALVGEHAHSKTIPYSFFHAPESIQRALIDGFMDGDGCYYENAGYTQVNICNESLLWQVRYLLGQLGYSSYIGPISSPGGPTNRSNIRDLFYLRTSFPFEESLTSVANKALIYDNLVGFIQEPKQQPYAGPVYNFETESHTYVANGIAVHNCNHMRDTPGQWLPEHEKFAFVFNPDPTFFDISEVKRPADRIAYYLSYHFPEGHEKAASEKSANYHLTGAHIAELYGLESRSTFTDFAKLAHFKRLSEMEANQSQDVRQLIKLASTSGFDREPISEAQMETLRSVFPGTLMRKMAQRQVPFSFLEFCRYVSGKPAEDIQKDAGYRKVACQVLPNLFETLSSANIPHGLEELFDPEGAYLAAKDPNAGDALDEALDILAQRHGVGGQQARNRVINITVIKRAHDTSSAPTFDKITVPGEDEYRNFAEAYGVYKVAFCSAVSSLCGAESVDDRFYGFIIGQNIEH